jgi:hypothetical protein
MSSANSLGTNITWYTFIQNNSYAFQYGLNLTPSWSGSYGGGTANFPYFTAPNGSNPNLSVIHKTESPSYNIVASGTTINYYINLSAAGYSGRTTTIGTATFT